MDRARFTLIELLVVIAIIGVLASMLLPALQQAKAKSQEVACKGNLKQAALSINCYTQDYEGFIPYNFPGKTGISQTGYSGGDTKSVSYMLYDYLKTEEIWKCPSPQHPFKDALFEYYYIWNRDQVASPPGWFVDGGPKKISKLSPDIWFIKDLDTLCYPASSNAPAHSKRRNVLFVDGHAASENAFN